LPPKLDATNGLMKPWARAVQARTATAEQDTRGANIWLPLQLRHTTRRLSATSALRLVVRFSACSSPSCRAQGRVGLSQPAGGFVILVKSGEIVFLFL
jgi:hypothetical protein